MDLDFRVHEVVRVLKVIPVAALHGRDVVFHHRHLCAEPRLEKSKRAGVVDVRVAVDHELDLFGFETQLADTLTRRRIPVQDVRHRPVLSWAASSSF